MGSDGGGESTEEPSSPAAPVIPKLKEFRIQIPSLQERMLNLEQIQEGRRRRAFSDFLHIRFSSPVAIFRRAVRRREEISLAVPSPAGVRRRFHLHFLRKINFSSILTISKEWLSHPMNSALLLWLLAVAASGIMLGLLMLGILDGAFHSKSLRNSWIEINNQILNALFTLMSIYQHPNLFHHLFMLFRWRSEDIIELRKIYCKNGDHRPNEWAHMMVVVFLLHMTCLAQYALCGVYWGFTSSKRPELLEYLFIALGIATPVTAGVYAIYSPLGREFESNSAGELQSSAAARKAGLKLGNQRIIVEEPKWVGGLFDCFSDVPVAYLSCCCSCCVFGWNMERLGFGNMYVHLVTFLLLCLAPFWIFNISAMKIHDYVIGDLLGISGIVLCVFGLIYGGYWRIQMRKRFRLPENRLCFGSASLTDYCQWFFCWSCALAQEVRTGNFYDVEDDSFYRRRGEGDEVRQPLLSSESSSEVRISFTQQVESSDAGGVEEQSFIVNVGEPMAPPVPPLMVQEDEVKEEVDLPLAKEEDERGKEAVLPLVKVEDDGREKAVLPLLKVEDDGGEEAVLPLVKVDGDVVNGEQGSVVKMTEFGLLFFVVLVYTMGSFIFH
ncbi:Protein plant cadmium resistance 10 [Apostasia shenzhenica]|uniref:Protein plant cadmium resistance 10 n=1 Tax=Apostasia shenzhenica TaxID=1088818 RepID=A0A2I0A8K2_9ASPA|nr:Protein plant cadmium resistance 10 [Apostasia shenzhenica]